MINKKIPYVNLKEQWKDERLNLLKIMDHCISKGDWVGGEEIKKFESKIAKKCNVNYCIALNSGTDALVLGLHLLGIKRGDEIITAPNSFIATAAAIVHLGAKPIFVDVLDNQNINPELIEKKITSKTKAIMPVHLCGRIANMLPIIEISKKYGIPIIEDAAQSIGSKYYNKPAGSFGELGCFSSHPLKNLNAIGDGGYITTNNKKIYNLVINLRNHGMNQRNIIKNFGYVSRMDNLQAAVLNYRLSKLDKIIKKRRENAKLYNTLLNHNYVFIPPTHKYEFHSYHTFVIQVKKRDKLKLFLEKNNIQTAIHYPIPIHLQPAAKKFNYKKGQFKNTEEQSKKILTLPINQYLTVLEIKKICKLINKFYK